VWEISGRYKFGEEFALRIDGAGVHAHAPGSPFGRRSACAFTRKLGGACPFAVELQAVHQPPPPAAACDECPILAAGCSRVWTQLPCLSHATQLRTSSPALHGQRYISKASTQPAADRPRLHLSLRVLPHGGSRGGWWDSKCVIGTRVALLAFPSAEAALKGKCASEGESTQTDVDPLTCTRRPPIPTRVGYFLLSQKYFLLSEYTYSTVFYPYSTRILHISLN
jgi:hypothetical protein